MQRQRPAAGVGRAGFHAIGSTETKDIVIPDLSHFCPFHGLGEAMKAILEHVAGARVWVIRP